MGPNGWQNAGQNAMGNGGMFGNANFNWGNAGNALGSIFGSVFGPDQGAPYAAAGQQYQQYANQANQGQQPFWQAGTNALPQYQNWLNSQQNAPGYVNSLMGQYQESPYAQYLQQQAQRAGTNAASASGLTGSTPFAQQMAQTANGISAGDLNSWLQNVLGINTQYGQGLGREVGWGQNAADQMSQTYNEEGKDMAAAMANQKQAQQNQQNQGLGGLGSLFGDIFSWI